MLKIYILLLAFILINGFGFAQEFAQNENISSSVCAAEIIESSNFKNEGKIIHDNVNFINQKIIYLENDLKLTNQNIEKITHQLRILNKAVNEYMLCHPYLPLLTMVISGIAIFSIWKIDERLRVLIGS